MKELKALESSDQDDDDDNEDERQVTWLPAIHEFARGNRLSSRRAFS